MDNNIILKAEDLVKKYGNDENAVFALDHVNFCAHKGEFVAVTGESGSGKTTLLNIIGTIDTPDSGSLTVNGEQLIGKKDDALSAYRRKNIGFIFQNYNLIPVLNVEENIMLPLNLDSSKPDMEYLEELLELTGLTKKRYSFPHQLSGGQKQRVAFVRALIGKPQIILADEPTGNLDSKNSKEIMTILKTSIRKYDQSLILVTHDPGIAAQADRITVMNDGVLTERTVE